MRRANWSASKCSEWQAALRSPRPILRSQRRRRPRDDCAMPPERQSVSDFDLTEKVCVVTGGGRGIGRAIAEGLARHGATLVLVGRTAATLSEAATAIGERACVQPADVAREADVLGLRDAVLD